MFVIVFILTYYQQAQSWFPRKNLYLTNMELNSVLNHVRYCPTISPQQSADPAWWTKHLSCSKTYNWKQKTWLVNPKMNQNFPLCLLVCKCFYLDKRKGFRISYENLDLPSWLPISSNAGKESLQNTTSSVSLDLLH